MVFHRTHGFRGMENLKETSDVQDGEVCMLQPCNVIKQGSWVRQRFLLSMWLLEMGLQWIVMARWVWWLQTWLISELYNDHPPS